MVEIWVGILPEWSKGVDLRSTRRLSAWVQTPQIPNFFFMTIVMFSFFSLKFTSNYDGVTRTNEVLLHHNVIIYSKLLSYISIPTTHFSSSVWIYSFILFSIFFWKIFLLVIVWPSISIIAKNNVYLSSSISIFNISIFVPKTNKW